MYEPTLRVGWDIEQVFSQDTTFGTTDALAIDYWRFEVVPFVDTKLALESNFQI